MPSSARELTNEDGQPIQLIRFLRGAVWWRYVKGDSVYVFEGNNYEPAGFTVSEITEGPEIKKLSITIELPSNLPVAENWRPYAPSDVIAVQVITTHLGETDGLLQWTGRVVNNNFDGGRLTLTADPTSIGARVSGSIGSYQRGCWKTQYSQGYKLCTLNPELFGANATLTAVVGRVLTATAFGTFGGDGAMLKGGWIQWTRADGVVERRSINAHAGTSVTVAWGAADLAVGLVVRAYPHCRQDAGLCSSYFSNYANNGGELDMPMKDPFAGNPP